MDTDRLIDLALAFSLKAAAAIAVLILGFILIGFVINRIKEVMAKRKMDPTLQSFLASILNISLRAALVIAVLSQLGIEVTSFIALLGAAGIAIGAALSGTLQNFAGGVMLLLFRPFKQGDFIEAQGYSGTVKEIQIFNTILKTLDNRTIIIPNGGLATGPMTNFSTEPKRRVVWTLGIGYGDNVDKAKEVIQNI
ncbi:MAG: mechanosensitive ion channel domain-containing protein, partial [Bacteroidota bacterium]